MDFIKTLQLLEDWKHLPAYRAEPRVDFIIAGALPEILMMPFKQEVAAIIPELPLRIGSIDPELVKNNVNLKERSYKVDFYALLQSGQHVFVEIKTDSRSRNSAQDKYLRLAKDSNFLTILEGIIQLAKVTSGRYRAKYQYLLNSLSSYGLIERCGYGYYPSKLACSEIDVIYIQPTAKRENEVGFLDIAALMHTSKDPVYAQFSKILESWSND